MSMPDQIVLATTNPHKLEEVRGVLGPAGVEVLSLADLAIHADPPIEDQPTFAGNAAIKARHYAARAARPCLADDSGLEVDALDGAPGVQSARYAGAVGDRAEVDAANNRRLVDALADVPFDRRTARYAGAVGDRAEVDAANNRRLVDALADVPFDRRTARYVCVMVLADGDRTLAEARGTLEGRILDQPRGSHGFGYDPHFWLDDRRCTVAELSAEQKNAISHRGEATRRLLERIQKGRVD